MKQLIIESYYDGKVLKTFDLPNAIDRSTSYKVESIGWCEYLVVRDYYTDEILHKFKKTGTKWDCSIEFYVKDTEEG